MKKSILLFSAISAFLISLVSYSQIPAKDIHIGPEKGSLVIVGGGLLSDTIWKKFIDLAGGPLARIVIIPTAGDQDVFGPDDAGAGRIRSLGVTNVTILHTRDKQIANSDAFVAPLVNATGVWFGGGRQWKLVDAYKDTKTEKLLWKVLDRGGVIGGSSAGATIQGSFLTRGDTKNNQIMMGDHQVGFGFVKNIAIDQHVMARGRQFDMFDILKSKPELLGIGIDEGTAIVVKGDTFDIIGKSYVIIYDGTFWSREGADLKNLPPKNERFYFLHPGDRYNLAERKVVESR